MKKELTIEEIFEAERLHDEWVYLGMPMDLPDFINLGLKEEDLKFDENNDVVFDQALLERLEWRRIQQKYGWTD